MRRTTLMVLYLRVSMSRCYRSGRGHEGGIGSIGSDSRLQGCEVRSREGTIRIAAGLHKHTTQR